MYLAFTLTVRVAEPLVSQYDVLDCQVWLHFRLSLDSFDSGQLAQKLLLQLPEEHLLRFQLQKVVTHH